MKEVKPQKTRVYLSIELLKSLTKKELEDLAYFAENKYFNTDKDLIPLLKKIKQYALKNEKFDAATQLKIYQKVFDDGASVKKELTKKQKDYLTNKLNALLRLAEQFLMIDYMKNKLDLKYELLYPQLIDKKQTLLFNRHLKRDQKKLEQDEKKSFDYHSYQYKFQNAILIYYYKEGLITGTDNYEELQYHMDMQYLLNKLKCHLAQITLDTYVTQKHYDFASFSSLKNLLALPQYNTNSMIQLYSLNIELIKNQNNETFNLLLNKLAEENDQIPFNFLKPFYSNITNYCVYNIKKGKLEYHKKLYNMYKQMHQNNLLLKDNKIIDLRLLKNVIAASCTVNKFEWAKQILHTYKTYLPLQIRDSILNYNFGKIAFEEGMFDKAHNYFINVEKIDNVYDINVRILVLKCIFEKGKSYSEATLQSFLSAKVFFKRNTFLTTSYKKGYINFIQILIELYKIKHHESKSSLDVVSKKLEKMEHVINTEWLIEKIQEIQ